MFLIKKLETKFREKIFTGTELKTFFSLYSLNFPPKMSRRDDKRKFKKYASNVVHTLTTQDKAYCVFRLSLIFNLQI